MWVFRDRHPPCRGKVAQAARRARQARRVTWKFRADSGAALFRHHPFANHSQFAMSHPPRSMSSRSQIPGDSDTAC
jgi:hypothetical protein